MNKCKETFGVDISKDVFDVHSNTNDNTFEAYTRHWKQNSFILDCCG